MKPIITKLLLLISVLIVQQKAVAQDPEKEVIQVAHDFFAALEKGDSTAFRALFIPSAKVYTVREKYAQSVINHRSPFTDTFRPGTVIKERMKSQGVVVQVHNRTAMIWAPYDLWVNDVFSHCGIDIFTLLLTPNGWRIASLAYSIENEGCTPP
ncbi:nuclear transport factor 2 family protein [Arundinibacter roseus]|uniref:Nuclear transport factor 2 family protein n=1 Tax=Arundinibacter roseus TaxID=2070510 RepID=A0A4V2XAU7_9BACT|nr:nuclear transport factor 2 family protein [Arundinibacter roseus]TDB68875.1 hypothetical protein EZE20_00610 [Arundinibacter roseus]